MNELCASIKDAINASTDKGRFIVFAYAAAPGDAKSIRLGVTTRRSYANVVQWVEHSYPDIEFHFGARQSPSLLDTLARDIAGVEIKSISPTGFDGSTPGHWQCLGQTLSQLMPRRWTHRGFALFDISGFSEEPNEVQVSRRLMLDGALLWARNVVRDRFASLPENPILSFSRVSTGDGYYLWSTRPGALFDAATFAMMLLTAAYIRARERTAQEWEVRAAFTVGKAVTLPYFGTWAATGSEEVPEDAVGPALNSLARILARAKPSQILLGDFMVQNADYKTYFSDPHTLLAFFKSILPQLLGTVAACPNEKLRVIDKHGDGYHCFNIAGSAYARDEWHKDILQPVGVMPDGAKSLDDMVFFREP